MGISTMWEWESKTRDLLPAIKKFIVGLRLQLTRMSKPLSLAWCKLLRIAHAAQPRTFLLSLSLHGHD